MKKLIIITSIFLIFTPVFGNNNITETLFLLGEYPDWEWVEFGETENKPKYHGQVKNGVPNGLGVLISNNGWKYFGSWRNGEIWNGTEYDNYGNIIYIWMEGEKNYHRIYRSY